MKKHLLAASLVMASLSSFGAGYQINVQGIRQLAMGGTGAAIPWDASTIFYNPGALARIKNIQAYASILAIVPSTAYGNYQGSARTVNQTFTPFNVYVGGTVRAKSRLALGIGFYTPFGTGTNWGNSWTGRYVVESINLKALFIQPTISYRLSEFLSVGGGFIYSTGTLDFTQALPVQDLNGFDGQAHLHGTANGVGFNLGAHLKFSDRLQVGLTYRSQINMDLQGGSATFTVPSSLTSQFPNTRFESALPLPQVATLGIAVKPLRNDRLTLEFDMNYTGWNSYQALHFNFANQTSSLQNINAPRNYKNTMTERLGANYKISKVVSVMGGVAIDPTPVTTGYVSPELPDADRYVFTCGAAVKPLKRFTILAACEFTATSKRNGTYDYANFNGTYQTQAITPGIGIYYSF